MEQRIAERKFKGVKSDGTSLIIHLGIGLPYKTKKGHWACPVSIAGLYYKLADQCGEDSLQSLLLAIKLCKTLLEGFIQDGGKIYSMEENLKVDVNELFESGI